MWLGVSVLQGWAKFMLVFMAIAMILQFWWVVVLLLPLVWWLIRRHGRVVLAEQEAADTQLYEEIASESVETRRMIGIDFDHFIAAINIAATEGQVSAALLERRLGVSLKTAARLTDLLALHSLVSARNGSQPRAALLPQRQMLIVANALESGIPHQSQDASD